jgi:hypothetical protein
MSLSVDHVNRIHFAGKQIKKIIGDQSQYKVILSDNRKDVFIQLNVKKDEIINMSVIDVSGKIADLEIKAINSPYPSIITLSSDDVELVKEVEETSEVDAMIKAMRAGVKSKYYTLAGGKMLNCGALGKNISCQIIADYRFGDYRGVGLRVVNKGKKAVVLDSDTINDAIPYKVLKQVPSRSLLTKSAQEIIYFVSKTEASDD